MAALKLHMVCGAFLLIFVKDIIVKATDDDDNMSLDEIVSVLEPFGDNCDQKPERDHIVKMIQNVEDVEMPIKCFRQCILQQFGVMTEDSNQYNVEKVVEMLNMLYPERDEETRQISNQCNENHIMELDKCEAAHKLTMCMLKLMRDVNYNIPEIK